MTWRFNIIKDKDKYYVGEVFIDDKGKLKTGYWSVLEDLAFGSEEELITGLTMILKDTFSNNYLEVKRNKLVKTNKKISKYVKRKIHRNIK